MEPPEHSVPAATLPIDTGSPWVHIEKLWPSSEQISSPSVQLPVALVVVADPALADAPTDIVGTLLLLGAAATDDEDTSELAMRDTRVGDMPPLLLPLCCDDPDDGADDDDAFADDDVLGGPLEDSEEAVDATDEADENAPEDEASSLDTVDDRDWSYEQPESVVGSEGFVSAHMPP